MTPPDSGVRDPGQGRQDRQPGPVTPDKNRDRRDRNLTPGDRDDKPILTGAEPPYGGVAATPARPHPATRTVGFAQAMNPAEAVERPAGTRPRTPDGPAATGGTTGPPEGSSPVWTVEAVRRLGLTTDIETAGSILGIGRTKAYELARSGNFPVKVLRNGNRYLVSVPAILRALDVD